MKKKKHSVTVLSLLLERIDLGKLLENVQLNENELIEAALSQPNLIKKAGQFRVQRMHKRTAAEGKLLLARSQAGLKFRSYRDAKGRKELSEGAVKERIELTPLVGKLQKRLNRAIVEEELGKMLQEVFRARSDSLRTIIAAGKVSIHAKELAFLQANKTLAKGVRNLRDRWENEEEN